ncbi:hypothetical protein FD754_007762 [Muntiacus muntjak]|uniref:P-selectin glycoprotein ligand 1 n=1 Tax=Muntiacus muntjak TaxID=9888 RepID=A0A5N3WTM8_MUNMU|nr:hypothetical protein FD754_007762 [Muntiacus muntjak]
MSLQLLLLVVLLGPGSSKNESVKAPDPPYPGGDWRDLEYYDSDYNYTSQTDPPEMLDSSTEAPTFLPMVATLGQREPAGPTTAESFILEASTRDSAVLSATGATTKNLSTELVTLVPLTRELVTEIPPKMKALSTELAAVTEALATDPAATEALYTEPTATEALYTEPTATETLSTEPAVTEALATEPKVIETLSTEPATTAAPFREPTTMLALPTDPTTVQALPTRPATTRGLTTALPVASDTPKGTTVAAGDWSEAFTGNKGQSLFPWSSVAPAPAESLPDPGPVKQCLLAILILALLATVFLVCTVVLAIRLSRKNHLYPVRDYSPSEMVCISSLLPEGGEGPTPMPNGDLPKAKDQGRKAGPGGDREGDDLTLRSFLP